MSGTNSPTNDNSKLPDDSSSSLESIQTDQWVAPGIKKSDSYYETKCDEPEYKYLKASDVRDQVTQFPLQQPPSNSKKRSKNYPKPFENHENLPLSVQPPYTEFPIISRQRSSGTHGIYSGGKKTKPGPVRAVYNENDMDTFDVAFHDPTKPKHTDRNGNKAKSHPFSLAVYHPASNPEKGSS